MSTSIEAVSDRAEASDAELARSIVADEPGAFGRLMRQHNRQLFRVARSILRDDAEAEDAPGQLYQAHRAMAQFRGDARLSTWLTRIIVNQALERRRRVAGARSEVQSEGASPPAPSSIPETPRPGNARGLATAHRAGHRRIAGAPVAACSCCARSKA